MKIIIYWNDGKKEWQIYKYAKKEPIFIQEVYGCGTVYEIFKQADRKTPQVFELNPKHLGEYKGLI